MTMPAWHSNFLVLVWEYMKCYLFVCRIKALAVEPYTQKEADRAAGMGCYKKPQPVDIRIPEESQKIDFNSELSGLTSNMSTL